MSGSVASKQLVFEDFQMLTGQIFSVRSDPEPVTITLTDAQLLRQARGFRPEQDRPPFVLIFHSHPDAMLAPGIYEMTCGRFGPESIYIEQTSPPDIGTLDGYYYQAVFN